MKTYREIREAIAERTEPLDTIAASLHMLLDDLDVRISDLLDIVVAVAVLDSVDSRPPRHDYETLHMGACEAAQAIIALLGGDDDARLRRVSNLQR